MPGYNNLPCGCSDADIDDAIGLTEYEILTLMEREYHNTIIDDEEYNDNSRISEVNS